MSGIYLIAAATGRAPTKIGSTRKKSVAQRLRELQVGSPVVLKIFHVFKFPPNSDLRRIETVIHENFSSYRLHGEWFDVTPLNLKKMIERLGFDKQSETKENIDEIKLRHKIGLSLSLKEWCLLRGVSIKTFRNYQKARIAPEFYQVVEKGKIMITREADDEWVDKFSGAQIGAL